MSESNAPDDALERIKEAKNEFNPVLDGDDIIDDETTLSHVPEDDLTGEPAHYLSVIRFDERDDRDAIIEDICENKFPSTEWVVVHAHSCTHEYLYDKYTEDPDYPPGEREKCDWGDPVYERGSVPDEFR